MVWFGIDRDLSRYDNGTLIFVSYNWNDSEPDCAENSALSDGTNLRLCDDTLNSILPIALHPGRPVVYVVFKTTNGQPSTVLDENQLVFPTIPADLTGIQSIPVSSLSRLRASSTVDPAARVEVVNVPASSIPLAFKHYPDLHDHQPKEELLDELRLLLRINSPYVIQPSHVVVQDNLFRGFLMPYFTQGSLAEVLRRSGQESLSWSVKAKWAFQISIAVATLHEQASYCGDLKLDNTLVSDTCDICLIDVAPTGGFTVDYVPPEAVDGERITLTEARDIYALGIILWAIAVHNADFHHEEIGSWEHTQVPIWYSKIVEECLAQDPRDRPTANVVVSRISQIHVEC